MGWVRRWLSRRGAEADLKEELSSHLEIEKAEQRRDGKSPEEAQRAASTLFGNVTAVAEDVRETWGGAPVERFVQDCRFGVRLLLRSPVWTSVICSMLALGIGMSTAIFSLVHTALLAPLPYPESNRIVEVSPTTSQDSKQSFRASPALWLYWRENLTSVSDVALTRPVANFNLTGDGAPERLQGARITFNVPRVLGLRPLLGRTFTEQEQTSGARVVLLSHGLWTRRFGAQQSIVGRKIQLNGEPFEVVGVMPAEFRYPDSMFELWAPLYLPPADLGHGFNYGFFCIGRLREGVSLARAQAEIHAVMRRVAEQYPANYREGNQWIGGLVEPLGSSQTKEVAPSLLVLGAAVLCLLAIGCMNLAVLLIARATGRAKEILVRVALGANKQRLRRQMLAEILPLGLAGAALGMLLASWILQVAVPMLPPNFPRIEAVRLNGPVLMFAIACSLGVVVLSGLLPSRLAGGVQLASALQRSSRGVTAGGVRDVLVVGQVALALLLLFGGLLFGRSLAALLTVQPGFAGEKVLTMHLAVSRSKYPEDPQVAEYYRRLAERIKTLPGVVEAGFINRLPLSGLAQTGGVEFEGKERPVMIDWRSVTPGYFAAIGIPLLRGRGLADSDRADSRRVGVIDAELAKRVFGDEDPVGKRFRRSLPTSLASDEPWSEIVGVVGHVLNDTLEKDTRSQAYWPETQRAQDRAALVVRTVGDPATYAKAIVGRIHEENAEQPVYEVRTMDNWVARSMQTRTLTTSVVSLFGFASVGLACLGLYGVISYATGLRLREFGIRLALGASGGEIRRVVLVHAGRLIGAGVAIGAILCWPAGQALRGFLFGVGNLDVVAWTLAPGLLISVGLLAALGPASRAAKADPAQVLRAE